MGTFTASEPSRIQEAFRQVLLFRIWRDGVCLYIRGRKIGLERTSTFADIGGCQSMILRKFNLERFSLGQPYKAR